MKFISQPFRKVGENVAIFLIAQFHSNQNYNRIYNLSANTSPKSKPLSSQFCISINLRSFCYRGSENKFPVKLKLCVIVPIWADKSYEIRLLCKNLPNNCFTEKKTQVSCIKTRVTEVTSARGGVQRTWATIEPTSAHLNQRIPDHLGKWYRFDMCQ